jgi:DNA-binding response OmpR family regulator
MAKILVVDDDEMSLEFLKIFLESEGHEVKAASNLKDTAEMCAQFIPDILISDLNLGDESGEFVIEHVKSLNGEAGVILITGYDKTFLNGSNIAYDHLLKKPVDLNDLQKIILDLS